MSVCVDNVMLRIWINPFKPVEIKGLRMCATKSKVYEYVRVCEEDKIYVWNPRKGIKYVEIVVPIEEVIELGEKLKNARKEGLI